MDQGAIWGALFTDLSKAFDYPGHDAVLAKLEFYGFNYESLKPINSYLTGRKHRTKINSPNSSFLDLLIKVSQRSILGSLLKNINSEKLLGLNIDNFLTCNELVSKLCKKSRPKITHYCTNLKLSE